jgi:hypothetical protein
MDALRRKWDALPNDLWAVEGFAGCWRVEKHDLVGGDHLWDAYDVSDAMLSDSDRIFYRALVPRDRIPFNPTSLDYNNYRRNCIFTLKDPPPGVVNYDNQKSLGEHGVCSECFERQKDCVCGICKDCGYYEDECHCNGDYTCTVCGLDEDDCECEDGPTFDD